MKNARLTIRSADTEIHMEAKLDELRGEVDRALDRIVPAACADGTLTIALESHPETVQAFGEKRGRRYRLTQAGVDRCERLLLTMARSLSETDDSG